MTLAYSKDSTLAINPRNSKVCRACGLYLNQLPATDEHRSASIFWVGLSAVAFSDDEDKVPLSPATRSGALVAKIEEPFKKSVVFYKTNLVKCLPLNEDKIRYPVQHEMEKCYGNLVSETRVLKPKVVFLLGKQVSTFVLSKLNIDTFDLSDTFNYRTFLVDGICYVPVHHPSFVLVYKRKDVTRYISHIESIIKSFGAKKTTRPKSKAV